MFPNEMQEVLAKVLFIIFAVLIVCFTPVRARETQNIASRVEFSRNLK